MKSYIFFFLFFVCISCSTGEKTTHRQDCKAITCDEFLGDPVYADLNLKNFRGTYGEEFKLKKFLRNVNERNRTADTIYQYIKGKNAFIFYASAESDGESFLTLKIADNRVEMENCVHIGMERNRLEELISDFPGWPEDTVKVDNGERQGVFIFKSNQLEKVHINNFYK
ncbi:MAG: hypothetical protein ACOCTU_05865 [Bacteroidota bacterium]